MQIKQLKKLKIGVKKVILHRFSVNDRSSGKIISSILYYTKLSVILNV